MRDSNPAPSARRDNTLPLHHWGWLHNFEEKSFKKSDLMPFGWTFRRQDDQALLTGLLPVKKQCKRIFHGKNEWKNIIMLYKHYKTTIHVLVCKVGHKAYVLLSRFPLLFWSKMVKMTSIFGSYRFLRVAWHDIFSLSQPSSKLEFVYPPCCGVEEQMLIFSSSLTPGRVKGSWFEIQSPS